MSVIDYQRGFSEAHHGVRNTEALLDDLKTEMAEVTEKRMKLEARLAKLKEREESSAGTIERFNEKLKEFEKKRSDCYDALCAKIDAAPVAAVAAPMPESEPESEGEAKKKAGRKAGYKVGITAWNAWSKLKGKAYANAHGVDSDEYKAFKATYVKPAAGAGEPAAPEPAAPEPVVAKLPKGTRAAAKPVTPPPAPVAVEAPGAPVKAKKGAKKPVKAPTPVEVEGDFELVDVDGGFYMVNKADQKAYRADLNKDGDERALLDQNVGIFKDGEILPIFDEDE